MSKHVEARNRGVRRGGWRGQPGGEQDQPLPLSCTPPVRALTQAAPRLLYTLHSFRSKLRAQGNPCQLCGGLGTHSEKEGQNGADRQLGREHSSPCTSELLSTQRVVILLNKCQIAPPQPNPPVASHLLRVKAKVPTTNVPVSGTLYSLFSPSQRFFPR